MLMENYLGFRTESSNASRMHAYASREPGTLKRKSLKIVMGPIVFVPKQLACRILKQFARKLFNIKKHFIFSVGPVFSKIQLERRGLAS